jgi:hypothetical protein
MNAAKDAAYFVQDTCWKFYESAVTVNLTIFTWRKHMHSEIAIGAVTRITRH